VLHEYLVYRSVEVEVVRNKSSNGAAITLPKLRGDNAFPSYFTIARYPAAWLGQFLSCSVGPSLGARCSLLPCSLATLLLASFA
jgi:hypothetical protein